MRNTWTRALVTTAAVLLVSLALPAVAEDNDTLCSLTETGTPVDPGSLEATLNLDKNKQNAGNCFCPRDLGADPTVAHGWACASTCSAARSGCQTSAYNAADAACFYGVCYYGNLTYFPATGCVYNNAMCPGKYLSDCDLDYWCLECLDEPEL